MLYLGIVHTYYVYPSLESFRRLMASVSSDTRQESFHVSLPRLQTSSRLTEEQPLLFSAFLPNFLRATMEVALKTSARRTTHQTKAFNLTSKKTKRSLGMGRVRHTSSWGGIKMAVRMVTGNTTTEAGIVAKGLRMSSLSTPYVWQQKGLRHTIVLY